MATEVRDKPAGKHDAFIEAQLARAENRIRAIDLCTAGLGFLAGTLAFTVLMVVLDGRFALGSGTRQFALLFYLAVAGTYLAVTVVRPLRWRINPYYAARQLEQTLPGSRNHVINWIDLHTEKVPSVLKTSLGQRAAKDLSKADVDRAISNRRALVVGGAAGFFVGLFVVTFLAFGPRPFGSLLARAFAPFGRSGGIASRTQVEIVTPRDTVVTIGNPITIVAKVEGRVPNVRDKDAPCLLYRHEEGEQYRQRFLQPDESNREWATTIGPLDVGNGFYYKVIAGDGESKEYRIDVRAAPLIGPFQATYTYRPYVMKASRTGITRKLEDLRGTDVEIIARTNRTIKEGRLDFEADVGPGDLIRAEPVPGDPQALRFRLTLDRAGKYRIRFTSTDNEAYLDTAFYDIRVIQDLAPTLRLTVPGKDVTLPANGHLELKGDATDDHGIARLTLHMEIVGGSELKPMPYMPDKLGSPNFGTPRIVEYSDLIELPSLKGANGDPVALKPGTVIEYWLEAADACDYPQGTHGNVARSEPRYKITIAEPAKDEAKEKKERDAARERQKEREKNQAEQMEKEKKANEEQRRKEEQQEKEDEKKRKEEKGGKGKEDAPKKPGKEDAPKKPEPNPNQDKKDKETEKKAEQIQEKMKNKEEKGKDKAGEDKPGEGRGENNKPGQGKAGEKKPGEDKGGKDKPGKGRGDGGQDGKNPAGTKKEGGGKDGDKGAAREGKADPTDRNGQGKNAGDKGETGKKPGEGKVGSAPKPKPGEDKGPGKGDPVKEAGERKPENAPKAGDQLRQGEARDSKTEGKPTDQKAGEGKDGARREAQGQKGEGKNKGEKAGEGKPGAGSKSGKDAGKDKPTGSGERRADAGEKKPGSDKVRPKAENAKPSDVEDIAKALKQADDPSRGTAKRALEDIKDKANDPAARAAAKKALEEAKKDAQPGQDKPAPGSGPGDKGENKPGEGAATKGTGEAKGGKPPADTESGNGKGAGKRGKPEEGKEEGDGPGKGKEPGDRDGHNPGDGLKGERRPGGEGGDGSDKRPDKEKPADHRASMMQLEEFRKKVDKDILKDMKMSPEEYEKFLRDYAELAKRREKSEGETPEVLPKPGAGKSLPNLVGKPRKPSGGTSSDTPGEGRPKPPPEYRDPFADFNRRLQTRPMK